MSDARCRNTPRLANASSPRSRTTRRSHKSFATTTSEWTGGYPDGLSGDDIPALSRIIAVADAYNAMTSNRPYRDAMPSRVARLRLAQAVDSQFDTSVVAAFEAILASANEDYRLGRGGEFALTPRAAKERTDGLRGVA